MIVNIGLDVPKSKEVRNYNNFQQQMFIIVTGNYKSLSGLPLSAAYSLSFFFNGKSCIVFNKIKFLQYTRAYRQGWPDKPKPGHSKHPEAKCTALFPYAKSSK